ncbi:hypothetical protein T459_15344 [Capsicum annuum]|uniref:Ubiquitin-like protease family profile domain-containing protein n=1 Tax=Capsicum annuum TaxID=4072 RepID=A0A2G2ZK19_CAPAN|nr:hypothetical protein T459_15344 [Capsicum annuum]
MELFGATTITRKIILEGGLVAVNDGSGSGAAVGANDAPLIVYKTTRHYDYDHTGCIYFSLDFATSNKFLHTNVKTARRNTMEYCQQKPEVSRNEECLINIIKGFSIPAGLPWNLVDEVYIPINCADEFHWVLAVVILRERCIRVYDSMLRRRHFEPSFEIQKLTKILPTYLDMSGFLDQKVRTDWSTIEAYRNGDCGLFISAYPEYLSDGLKVPNDELDAGLLRKIYAALLWKYEEAKAHKLYTSDIKDPRRPKPNFVAPDEEKLVYIE